MHKQRPTFLRDVRKLSGYHRYIMIHVQKYFFLTMLSRISMNEKQNLQKKFVFLLLSFFVCLCNIYENRANFPYPIRLNCWSELKRNVSVLVMSCHIFITYKIMQIILDCLEFYIVRYIIWMNSEEESDWEFMSELLNWQNRKS